MWCPEGYTTLHDLSENIDGIAEFHLSQVGVVSFGDEVTKDDPEYLSEEYWPDFWHKEALLSCRSERNLLYTENKVFHAWLVAATLTKFQPYVSSHDGKIMQVSDILLSHEIGLGYYKWDKFLTAPGLRNYVHQIAFSDKRPSPFEGFIGLSYPDGIVSNFDENKMLRWGIFTPFDMSQLHANFSGWSVCFKEDEVPYGESELLIELGLPASEYWYSQDAEKGEPYMAYLSDNNSRSRGKPVGRPFLQGIAAAAYLTLYPNGHGSTPIVTVEDSVSKYLGRKISWKTISRGMQNGADKLDRTKT